jgi:hypothetical protein
MIKPMNKPAPKLPPVCDYKKGDRIRTRAGKTAFVLEDSKGMAIVNVRFLDNSTAQIPARFILGGGK